MHPPTNDHNNNNNNRPVSYDTRDMNAKDPSHWRDEELLGERAIFRAGREPAELIINPVRVINSFIIINDYKLCRIVVFVLVW